MIPEATESWTVRLEDIVEFVLFREIETDGLGSAP